MLFVTYTVVMDTCYMNVGSDITWMLHNVRICSATVNIELVLYVGQALDNNITDTMGHNGTQRDTTGHNGT